MCDVFLRGGMQARVVTDGSATTEERVITVGSMVMQAEAGTVVETSDVSRPSLEKGTVLVSSPVLFHLQVNDMDLQGWNGAFHVSKEGDRITIAALTTPVLVTVGTHQTIVPASMQWNAVSLDIPVTDVQAWVQARATLPLPQVFLQDQLRTISTLPAPRFEDALSDTSFVSPTLGQSLRLPSAQDRAESAERMESLESVRKTLESSPAQIDALLLDPDTEAALHSAQANAVLPTLESLALSAGKGDLFLPAFTASADRLLLASFHPLLRDHARVLPITATLTDDQEFSLLLLTTLSDLQPQALSSLAITPWQTLWSTYLSSHKDAEKTFAAALPILQSHIERMDSLQYPERVYTYTNALLDIGRPYWQVLSPEARTLLNEIHTLRDARRVAAPLADSIAEEAVSSSSSLSSPSSSSSVASTPSVSNDVLVQQAERILQAAGFMMTPKTLLKPVSNGVQVTDIIVGTKTGDQAMQFVFNPDTNMVSDILQDGVILPYAITLEQFLDWVKGS